MTGTTHNSYAMSPAQLIRHALATFWAHALVLVPLAFGISVVMDQFSGQILNRAFWTHSPDEPDVLAFAFVQSYTLTIGIWLLGFLVAMLGSSAAGHGWSLRNALPVPAFIAAVITGCVFGWAVTCYALAWLLPSVPLAVVAGFTVLPSFAIWQLTMTGVWFERLSIRQSMRRGLVVARCRTRIAFVYTLVAGMLFTGLIVLWIVMTRSAPVEAFIFMIGDDPVSDAALEAYMAVRAAQAVTLIAFVCVLTSMHVDLRMRVVGETDPWGVGFEPDPASPGSAGNTESVDAADKLSRDPFFAWFRRPYLPARWLNRVMPLVLAVVMFMPIKYWDALNKHSGGLLGYIGAEGVLIIWVLLDEVRSRRTTNTDSTPAFATRMKQRIWPHRPRQRANQVGAGFVAVLLAFALLAPTTILSWEVLDAVVSIELLVGAVIASVWILYVLVRMLRDAPCAETRLLAKVGGVLSSAGFLVLIDVALITVGSELTGVHGVSLVVGLALMIPGTLADEISRNRHAKRRHSIVRRLYPCDAPLRRPSWW